MQSRLFIAVCLLIIVSCAPRARKPPMTIERKNPAAVAPPIGSYSHLALVPAGSGLVVLAGQLGVDVKGQLPATPEEQLRNAFANVLAILRSEGISAAGVIKVNIWLVRPIEGFGELWSTFHGGQPPPTTVAYVAGLFDPKYLVEVEVWAARPTSAIEH